MDSIRPGALLQLVANAEHEQRNTRKTMYVSRVIEYIPDPQTGRIVFRSAYGFCDSIENIWSFSKKQLELTSTCFVNLRDPYYEWIDVHPIWRKTKQIQLIEELPLPGELCEYIQDFLGYKDLGLQLPRYFSRSATWSNNDFRENPQRVLPFLITPQLPQLDMENIQPYSPEKILFWPYKFVWLIRKSDVQRNPLAAFKVEINGLIMNMVQGLWLLTEKQCQVNDAWIMLPFFPFLTHHGYTFLHATHDIPVYYALQLPKTEMNLFESPERWFLQIGLGKQLKYDNKPEINVESYFFRMPLSTCVRMIFCYKDRPVKIRPNAKFTHPVKTISFWMPGSSFFQHDGDYFQTVVPSLYGKEIDPQYLVYYMIFQEPPKDYVNANPIGHSPYLSTINFSRIDEPELKITWDEDVLREQFEDPTQCSLYIYVENINLARHREGILGLVYYN